MEHKPNKGLNELRMLKEGEHTFWIRESPVLRREMTIYTEVLTPDQRERFNQIEQELLEMAYEATEESKTKTVLKGKFQ
jgi:hypothetical protein